MRNASRDPPAVSIPCLASTPTAPRRPPPPPVAPVKPVESLPSLNVGSSSSYRFPPLLTARPLSAAPIASTRLSWPLMVRCALNQRRLRCTRGPPPATQRPSPAPAQPEQPRTEPAMTGRLQPRTSRVYFCHAACCVLRAAASASAASKNRRSSLPSACSSPGRVRLRPPSGHSSHEKTCA